MKFGALKSVGHNIADSLASGCCLLINDYFQNVFGEAAKSPGRVIEIDFLVGEVVAGDPSAKLTAAAQELAEVLPGLCARQGVSIDDVGTVSAKFYTAAKGRCFVVTVADREGRRSVDEYVGNPGKLVRGLDKLGRVRRRSNRSAGQG
ncbi:MAG: hypothetical protein AAF556_01335 [Pseudomonadota bacterium]